MGRRKGQSDSDDDTTTTANVDVSGWESYKTLEKKTRTTKNGNSKKNSGGGRPTRGKPHAGGKHDLDKRSVETEPESTGGFKTDSVEVRARGRGQLPLLTSFGATSVSHTGSMGSAGKTTIRTVFAQDDAEEVQELKRLAREPISAYEDGVFGLGAGQRGGMPISPDFQKTFIRIPERPKWYPGMSASALHAQEESYFLQYLTNLYEVYGASRLNHFEHNLAVWRQLWRVVEKSDILVLVADCRHPLLHFNRGVYEYARASGKPMVLLLNKIDTLPVNTVRRWQRYFNEVYPDLHTVLFSSYPSALHRALLDADLDETLAAQISALELDLAPADLSAHAREVGKKKRAPRVDALGVADLLQACREIVMGSGAECDSGEDAGVVDFEATRLLTERDQALLADKEAERKLELRMVKDRLMKLAKYQSNSHSSNTDAKYVMDEEDDDLGDEECQADTRALALMRVDDHGNAPTARGPSSSGSALAAVGDVNKVSWREGRKAREAAQTMCAAGDDDSDGDMSLKRRRGKGKGRGGASKAKDRTQGDDDDSDNKPLGNDAKARRTLTIGTIGHPNAGKSSLINALTGKKVVSVSRQPGHTKTFQTMLINDHTVLCDCPGLVFPAVDVPRPLQVLSGIFPIPQTRQPMAAVRFLAKCVQLDSVLGVSVPRPVSAVSLCEAYAAKRGFMLSHGRCDSNRAAQTLLYACVDGKLQFFFEAPEV